MDDDDERIRLMRYVRHGMHVPVDVIPGERTPPWEGDPNYGREVDIPQTLQPGELRGVLGPKLFPLFPAVWTMSCQVSYDDDPAVWQPAGSGTLGRAFSLLGNIQFGTGGAQQTMEFDWIQGTQITLPLATVKVAIGIDPFVANSIPPNCRASVVLAPGSPCRDLAPTRTIYLGDNGGGFADETFRIPPFAKSFTFLAEQFDPAIVIEVKTGPDAADGVLYATTAGDLRDGAINGLAPKLFGAAKYVRVAGVWGNGNLIFFLEG